MFEKVLKISAFFPLNKLSAIFVFTSLLVSCALRENPNKTITSSISGGMSKQIDTATLGSGCFWCTEAIFEQLEGVLKVTSGYSGGHVVNPTYEQVCEKNTGHAEVVQVIYDSTKLSFADLLDVFWKTHDPTTLNRQGNDEGPQYRSVIFYHNEEQREIALHYKVELDKSGVFDVPIVTEITPFTNFYPAENYHQNYFINNSDQPYCNYVIRPKLEKFIKEFKDKLRK
jgi:peptide-methionine (S)-S-oxide reductase